MVNREDLLLQLNIFLLEVYTEMNNVVVLQGKGGWKKLRPIGIVCVEDYSVEEDKDKITLTIKSGMENLVFNFRGDIELEENDEYITIISDNKIVKLEIF